MKKSKSPQEQVDEIVNALITDHAHWENLRDYGCSDPFWPDGTNMNLTRNHIIYYRKQIEALCNENSLPLPAQWYLPIPPEVDEDYMANLEQTDRVKRLRQSGNTITHKVPEATDQLTMF